MSLLNAAKLRSAEHIDVLEGTGRGEEQPTLDWFRTILSYVDGSLSTGLDKRPRLKPLTVLTNNINVFQFERLQQQNRQRKGLKVFNRGIGLWTVSLGPHFQINIVHRRIRDAWNTLQANPKASLETVTYTICSQAYETQPDGRRLTDLYLLRAALGLKIWIEVKETPSKSTRLHWTEMTAMSFVDGYITDGRRKDGAMVRKFPTNGADCDERVLLWANAVLLQVVSPSVV